MTHDRDLDRLLDAWFADGPGEPADRVLDEVAARIHRQGQRPAWRLRSWRFTTMSAPIRLIALAGALLATGLLAGALLLGGGSTPAPTAIPAPSAATPPAPTATPPPSPEASAASRAFEMRAVAGDPLAFTITAPDSWTPFGEFFLAGPNTSGGPAGIGISVNHDPEVTTDPCDASVHTPEPSAKPASVDDLVSAIRARADLEVSGVTDVELAGYRGKRLDVQFPPDLVSCGSYYLFAEPKGLYANGPANHWRVWLLDVDGETAVIVLLDYAATPAADRAAAEAAIDSVRITR